MILSVFQGVRTSMDFVHSRGGLGFSFVHHQKFTSNIIGNILDCHLHWGSKGLDEVFLKTKYTMGVEDVCGHGKPEKWLFSCENSLSLASSEMVVS